MSIDAFYKQTFIPIIVAPSTVWPFDPIETDGTPFKGALDTVSSNDKWADSALIAMSTHFIATKTSVSISKGMILKYDTRRFEVMGIPDSITLKPGHHQEIYVKEITQ